MYRDLGRIIVNWGLAEQGLESCISLLFHQGGGKATKHGRRGLPRSLTSKTGFIKDCVRDIPGLAPFRKEGRELAIAMDDFSRFRDSLVHGVVSSYDTTHRTVCFRSLEIDRQRNVHRENERWIALAEIRRAGPHASRICNWVADYARRLADALIA